jgi:hypothetical protein
MTGGDRDYSGTPLVRKLGIKDGSAVLLVSAPEGFLETLGSLPPRSEIVDETASAVDVVVLFAKSENDLEPFRRLAARLEPSGELWVAWPKKSSSIATSLDFESVQKVGLAAGLVDNKSCAIDEDWQALRFVVRLVDRKPRARAR